MTDTVNSSARQPTIYLSTSITEAHPEFDWAAVVEIRNIIVHEYFGIDSEIVVTTFERDLAPLASAL